MGFIPSGARWYLADVVLEHRIDGDPRNVVHVNTHLIAAGSPDEAYTKALAIGQEGENEYLNIERNRVQVIFRGIKELIVLHEELEDGAELMYSSRVGVAEDELKLWNKPKDRLAVCAPIEPDVDSPNYMPGFFSELVDNLFPNESQADDSKK